MQIRVIAPRHDTEASFVQKIKLKLMNNLADKVLDVAPAFVTDTAAGVQRKRQVDLVTAR